VGSFGERWICCNNFAEQNKTPAFFRKWEQGIPKQEQENHPRQIVLIFQEDKYLK